MWSYTSAANTAVTDGAGTFIPCDPENAGWQRLVESGVEISPYVPPPEPVPDSVDARQIRLFWLNQNLLQEIEAMWPTWPSATQIDYHYAQRFTRASPAIKAVAAALKATEATVDEWFIAAAKL